MTEPQAVAEWGTYQFMPALVLATQWQPGMGWDDATLAPGGAQPGDYLVRSWDGSVTVMPEAVFRATYQGVGP